MNVQKIIIVIHDCTVERLREIAQKESESMRNAVFDSNQLVVFNSTKKKKFVARCQMERIRGCLADKVELHFAPTNEEIFLAFGRVMTRQGYITRNEDLVIKNAAKYKKPLNDFAKEMLKEEIEKQKEGIFE